MLYVTNDIIHALFLSGGMQCMNYANYIVVGCTTICVISAHHNKSYKFEYRAWRSELNTLCDKVCQ